MADWVTRPRGPEGRRRGDRRRDEPRQDVAGQRAAGDSGSVAGRRRGGHLARTWSSSTARPGRPAPATPACWRRCTLPAARADQLGLRRPRPARGRAAARVTSRSTPRSRCWNECPSWTLPASAAWSRCTANWPWRPSPRPPPWSSSWTPRPRSPAASSTSCKRVGDRVETVVFALTKTDQYRGWRQVLDADQALLAEHAPRFADATFYPVSSRMFEHGRPGPEPRRRRHAPRTLRHLRPADRAAGTGHGPRRNAGRGQRPARAVHRAGRAGNPPRTREARAVRRRGRGRRPAGPP